MKTWYLKFMGHTIGELLYYPESDEYCLDVSRPDMFKGRLEKCFLNNEMCRRWMLSRLTPEYQGGYREKIIRWGLNPDDPAHRIQLFFLSKAGNMRDGMWIADNEKDDTDKAPFYGM